MIISIITSQTPVPTHLYDRRSHNHQFCPHRHPHFGKGSMHTRSHRFHNSTPTIRQDIDSRIYVQSHQHICPHLSTHSVSYYTRKRPLHNVYLQASNIANLLYIEIVCKVRKKMWESIHTCEAGWTEADKSSLMWRFRTVGTSSIILTGKNFLAV